MEKTENTSIERIGLKLKKLEGMSILHIEDDPIITEIIKTFFTRLEIAIKCAVSLEAGLEILQNQTQNKIALIITDGLLPNANKEKILTEIKKTNSEIPVILATGELLTDEKVRELGFNGFLQKPFFIKKIIEEVKKVLA